MAKILDFPAIGKRIAESNLNAAGNQNLYPIQEQATLKEIWEYVPCTCDESCTCRRFGCTHHWRLRNNLEFGDILPAFLRMFVNKPFHMDLIRFVNEPSSGSEQVSERAQGALMVLRFMRSNWTRLYTMARQHKKMLICDDWYNDYWLKQWDFPWQEGSIYRAKQYSIFLPDIAVPYDTSSRLKLQQTVTAGGSYFHLLQEIRRQLITILQSNRQTIAAFRRLDAPQGQIPFNSKLITLPKANMIYGYDYSPTERPLSRVIDKYFYQPGSVSNERQHAQSKNYSKSIEKPSIVFRRLANNDQQAIHRNMQRDEFYYTVRKIFEKKFTVNGNPAHVPKVNAGYFTAEMTDEGIFVDNLNSQPFLPWVVFLEAVVLMLKNNGSAAKGDAMNCKLGDEKLGLNSIEGHVAKVVYNKQPGSSVFRRITPIACILIWVGLCKNAPGRLILNTDAFKLQNS